MFALELKFALKIACNVWVMDSLLKKQIEEEVGRNTLLRHVFLPTLLSCSNHFLRALQQNRACSRLLYFLIKGWLGRQFCMILILKLKCKLARLISFIIKTLEQTF